MSLIALALLLQDEMPMPKPGEHHEHMKAFVGTWEATIQMNAPDGTQMEGKGTQTDKLCCGDLWLTTDFDGEFGGMPFTGHGTMGYDPEKKKYVGIWVDSMVDYMQHSEGECSDDGKTFTMIVKAKDHETGAWTEMKEVSEIVDKDNKTLTFYSKAGEEWEEIMKIEYKRKK